MSWQGHGASWATQTPGSELVAVLLSLVRTEARAFKLSCTPAPFMFYFKAGSHLVSKLPRLGWILGFSRFSLSGSSSSF